MIYPDSLSYWTRLSFKPFFFLLIFLGIAISGLAQLDSMAFGGGGMAYWRYRCADDYGENAFQATIHLSPDTVTVNGHDYFPMLSETVAGSSMDTLAYYREENDQVYCLKRIGFPHLNLVQDTAEFLLYDYTLQIGDTFWFEPLAFVGNPILANPANFGFVVVEIDSVLLHDGGFRTRWTFSDTSTTGVTGIYTDGSSGSMGNAPWVREIGTEAGPNYTDLGIALSATCFFSCYWNEFSANDSIFGTCIPLGIDTKEDLLAQLELFPNPASNQVSLSLDDYTGTPVSIEIVDAFGQIVLQQNWQAANHQKITIKVTDLKPGNYVVRIAGEESFKVKKLIIF